MGNEKGGDYKKWKMGVDWVSTRFGWRHQELEEAYQCLRKFLQVWLASLSFSTIHISFSVDLRILFDALIWILDAPFHFVDHWFAIDLLPCYSSLLFKLNLGINMKVDSFFFVIENHDSILLLSSLKSFHLHFKHTDNP